MITFPIWRFFNLVRSFGNVATSFIISVLPNSQYSLQNYCSAAKSILCVKLSQITLLQRCQTEISFNIVRNSYDVKTNQITFLQCCQAGNSSNLERSSYNVSKLIIFVKRAKNIYSLANLFVSVQNHISTVSLF